MRPLRFGKAKPAQFVKLIAASPPPLNIDDIDEELERICGEKPFDAFELREHLSQLEDRP
jgi:hypothetical protein